MELLIETPQVPVYRWNYEEIKAAAVAKAKEYSSIVYTDADEVSMKKDRADLNRIINGIEDERKRLKKECMAPYNLFEQQVKEVLAPLRDAVGTIDKGLSEIEKAYRDGKTAQMRELYNSLYADVSTIVPFQRTVKEEWYKKAFTDKKLEKAYSEVAAQVHDDLALLDRTTDAQYKSAAISAYLTAFSLSDAQAEVYRLHELDKARAEREAKQLQWQEELKRKEEAEAERQKALADQREKLEAEAQATAPVLEPTPAPAPAPAPIVSFGPIICYGTREQLMGLAGYLREHGIRCEKAR